MRIKLLVLIYLMSFISAVQGSEQLPQWRVLGDPWPPWMDAQKNEEPHGYAVNLVTEIFKRLEMSIKIEIVPFKRGLKSIEKGDADMIMLLAENEERRTYMHFTAPLRKNLFQLYQLNSGKIITWNDWEDLKPYRIGVVRGFNYGDAWHEAVDELKLDVRPVAEDGQNLGMLALGRIDLAIVEEANFKTLTKETPSFKNQIKALAKPINLNVSSLGISKKSALAEHITQINKVIAQMRADGTYDAILAKPAD